jgi:cation:H+ antiporter
MPDYLILVVGFVLLILGANYLVDGAVGLARHFRVGDLVIGLTIVAFGTSAPELVVNLFAAADPTATDIALTNIIGSNTINIFIILGLSALVRPIVSQRSSRRFDIPLSLLAIIAILLLAWGFSGTLTRVGGVILLVVFALFMLVTIRQSARTQEPPEVQGAPAQMKKRRVYVLMIVGGLVGLVVAGQMIVGSATRLAEALGVSQAVIGLTIVALGTSLPELATSVVAAAKRNSDIALGNVIGSNIFNVFFILGTSALIRPLPAYSGMVVDLVMAALGALLVWVFVLTNKKHAIKRWEGALLLCLYAVYLYRLIES